MTPFLEQLAQKYYDKYANELSDFAFVFPNRRAGLFFRKALGKVANQPLFAPEIIAINDLFFKESQLLQADKVTLLFTLYNSFKKVVNKEESFDTFIFLGDMLLSDFNEIDKYLIDAKQLFQNISDIKEIESDFSWMSDEQKSIIQQFWGYFLTKHGRNLETQFVEMWSSLFTLYNTFREDLRTQGIGYDGMIFRDVIERDAPLTKTYKRVVFVGFNALTATEEKLFKRYQTLGIGDYYFDYQSPEIRKTDNVANQFRAENETSFKSEFQLEESFEITDREIKLIAIPSDIGQTKQVYTILNELQAQQQEQIGLKTAIVLPDEKLLIPMLHAIPESIDTVNVTMGYPLSLTPIAALMDHLVALQKNSRLINEKSHFYYKHVLAILNHPYIVDYAPNEVEQITAKIHKDNLFFVNPEDLQKNDFFKKLFIPINDTDEFIAYFSTITQLLSEQTYNKNNKQLDREYFAHYQAAINRLEENLHETKINLSTDTFFKLLKQLTSNITVAFKGEPLEGLQIMGTLETRALDFDNVIITSFNEGVFPRKNTNPSVIPYSLRRAFSLPTYEYHDAIFAYNFYRMIYRAKRLFLLYNSRTDGQHGELSRYAAQLEFLYQVPITHESVSYSVSSKSEAPIVITKDQRIMERLARFTDPDSTKAISASDINNYIDCPLRFYFSKIEDLAPLDTISDTMEANLFGTLFHAVMESIYEPYKGEIITKEIINQLIQNTVALDQSIYNTFNEKLYKNKTNMPLLGENLLIANIIKAYVIQTLKFDQNERTPFRYLESELPLKTRFTFGNELTVNLKGFIDRVDEQDGVTHIIDYKTGKTEMSFQNIDVLFDNSNDKRPRAVLQTFFYAMLYQVNRNTTNQLKPAIYSLRNFENHQITYKPSLHDSSEFVTDYNQFKTAFETKLAYYLSEIFDAQQPFEQCRDTELCEYCDFKTLCNR
ncbi:MAG TPA: PD-(D/E)XK nuclease family protein [Paludibacteraceae bacterium]|nr:PD-(D/E)XK nuclease family protein [Paludibacteraceae bacterium]